jgi:hypothetical protein
MIRISLLILMESEATALGFETSIFVHGALRIAICATRLEGSRTLLTQQP